ncbi:MAG: MFS transporter [Arenicella sp.]
MSRWYLEYSHFVQRHCRFLGFGLLICFISSAGQTYLIGIFGPEIRSTFSLTHTEWGTLYLIGTLASAVLIPWSGQLIDKIDLRYFSVATMVGLAIACLAISNAHSITWVVIAIFLLRQFGQGLASHIGITSMARYFDENRGKAIALSTSGFSLGEAILPFLAILAISALGWRSTYEVIAYILLLLIPVMLWLLKGHNERHSNYLDSNDSIEKKESEKNHYTRMQVLKETRFYLMFPAMIAPPFIITAMFFHHLNLAESKHWSPEWVTGSYWVFALATIVASLISGPAIDKITAERIMPFFLLPMVAGLALIAPADSEFWLYPYLFLTGVSTGIYFTGMPSMWTELYGAKNIGAIKSLMTALSVLASALSPVSAGLMLDANISMSGIYLWFAGASILATGLFYQALKIKKI